MRIATIGSGMIVERFLAAQAQVENVECVAMYTRVKSNATSLADTFSIKDIYTDLDEMLEREDIDFVYIASPNSLHYSQAMKCIEANKHVLCEKLFTSNTRELKALIAFAKKQQRFLYEMIVTMHMPNYKLLKEQLSRCGEIHMVQCNFSQYSSRYDALMAGEQPNVFNPDFSGGALADLGIYNIHFVVGLFGRPEKVQYFPHLHNNRIDTSGVAILKYKGFQATCVACKDCDGHNLTQIQGDKGFFALDSQTSRCNRLRFQDVRGQKDAISLEHNDNPMVYELQDIVKLFEKQDLTGCQSLLQHSIEVMETFEELRKSANIIFKADQV